MPILGLLMGSLCFFARVSTAATLEEARSLYRGGRYEEAIEQYSELQDDHPAAAAIGRARSHAAIGEYDTAAAALKSVVESNNASADALAEAARLAFERGDIESAQGYTARALTDAPNHLLGRWIDAEIKRVTGKTDDADAVCEALVDYYNANDVADAESLHWIGLAAARFARQNALTDQFKFLVNELYPDALAIEPDYGPAYLETARLFLEKYNQAEADRSLKAALRINPRSAEAHAAMATLALQNWDLADAQRSIDRALEINPQLAEAHRLQADVHLANFDTVSAAKVLAVAEAVHPSAEETLGRVGAVYLIEDGLRDADANVGGRFEQLAGEVTARNPAAGVFYFTAAERLEQRRKFIEAEYCFRQAIERSPRLLGPRAGLGMMYMRLGREAEAKDLLDASFERDPFHVRVNNTLKVLEVLETYETLETDHFLIRYDAEKDAVLARYAADYLESIYPSLCKQFGFEPPDKSLFEVFSRARNTAGHGWFSARMVGLPYIGTVGACAGKMVALASPNDTRQKFNWATVLKHEFIHVINLQQTNYNLPHWFAEAIAVYNEGYPRPETWDRLLLERVPKDEVFDLDSINLGFIRPKSGIDWQMAYCQAELYAEYMVERFGEDAFAKLLAAYRDNLTTQEALRRCFDVDQADFEAGYRDYMDRVVAEIQIPRATETADLGDLEQASRDEPENPDAQAELAYALLARKTYAEARQAAARAIALDASHALANYVVARLQLLIGETRRAIETLESSLDRAAPNERVLNLLAALYVRAEDYSKAEALYQIGVEAFPGDVNWQKRLARVYLNTRNDEALVPILEDLAQRDGDDLTVRKKLAQIAFAEKKFADSAEWSNQAIQIDVMDADSHRLWARALAEGDDLEEAIEQTEVAIEFYSDDRVLVIQLASLLQTVGRTNEAIRLLDDYLAKHDDETAQQLLEKLKR